MSNTAIIIVAAAAVVALLLLLLIRGRKQRVTFSDTPPLPRAAAPTPSAKPEPQPAPVAPPAPPSIEPAAGPADNLTAIKGLGPKAAGLLNGLGVTRYEQMAAWTDADIAAVDAQMGTFQGRIRRDRWVEQARLLAKGDTAAFEAEFGKLGG